MNEMQLTRNGQPHGRQEDSRRSLPVPTPFFKEFVPWPRPPSRLHRPIKDDRGRAPPHGAAAGPPFQPDFARLGDPRVVDAIVQAAASGGERDVGDAPHEQDHAPSSAGGCGWEDRRRDPGHSRSVLHPPLPASTTISTIGPLRALLEAGAITARRDGPSALRPIGLTGTADEMFDEGEGARDGMEVVAS